MRWMSRHIDSVVACCMRPEPSAMQRKPAADNADKHERAHGMHRPMKANTDCSALSSRPAKEWKIDLNFASSSKGRN